MPGSDDYLSQPEAHDHHYDDHDQAVARGAAPPRRSLEGLVVFEVSDSRNVAGPIPARGCLELGSFGDFDLKLFTYLLF
jgi:hypothetical protein